MTNRDAWAWNPGRAALVLNMSAMIGAYNSELERFGLAYPVADRRARSEAVNDFVDANPKRISWTHNVKADLVKAKPFAFNDDCMTLSLYRPFTRQWLYYSRTLNERVYQMPRIFPMGNAGKENRLIMIKQRPPTGSQFALMVNSIPELQADGGTQCFPRWIYEQTEDTLTDELVFGTENPPTTAGTQQRRDAITDAGLAHFQAAYPDEAITKDDLFHYTYGVLHSPDYRSRFADNLSKQLPRIPVVTTAESFRTFVSAGQELANLHCGFEDVDPFPVTIEQGDLRLAHIPDPVRFYRVEKMKFGGRRPKLDRTTVIYNPNITITGIPPEAYDYVVNGKPALEWVMERQCVRTDPASGIVSDANAFANETMENPAYPFELFCRVITVSLRTMEIVRSLPALDIAPAADASVPGSGITRVATDEELEAADAAG